MRKNYFVKPTLPLTAVYERTKEMSAGTHHQKCRFFLTRTLMMHVRWSSYVHVIQRAELESIRVDPIQTTNIMILKQYY